MKKIPQTNVDTFDSRQIIFTGDKAKRQDKKLRNLSVTHHTKIAV